MTPLDTKELEKNLAAKNWDGAKQILNDFFAQELTPQEKGEAYVAAAELYMEVNNAVNARYSAELDSAIAKLRQIQQSEQKLDDTGGLLKARKTIKGS